jgi:ribosomal protein S4
VIQSWKALNLYNLATYTAPRTIQKTFYQQKWLAKSHTRTYHGRQVREKQWQLMFNRRIPAVVDMDVSSLAKDEGARQAAGRGSGRDQPPWMRKFNQRSTPYSGMTFWPLERRLDTAVFRAMFASSVRTARQFVVHGHVKVNGKKVCVINCVVAVMAWDNGLMMDVADEISWLPAEPRRHVQRRS